MYKDCWFCYKLCFNASGKKNYQQNRSSNLHKYQLASTHTSVIPGVINWTYNSSSNYRQAIIPLRAAHKQQPSPQHFSFLFRWAIKIKRVRNQIMHYSKEKVFQNILHFTRLCNSSYTFHWLFYYFLFLYIFIQQLFAVLFPIEVCIFAANFPVFKLTQESY